MQPALVESGLEYRFDRYSSASRFLSIVTLRGCKQLVNCSLQVLVLVLIDVLVHFKILLAAQAYEGSTPIVMM